MDGIFQSTGRFTTTRCQVLGEKMHWPSHRLIDRYAKDLVRQLRENNVSLGKVFSIVGSFFGSVDNVPFTKKSLRTLCCKLNK